MLSLLNFIVAGILLTLSPSILAAEAISPTAGIMRMMVGLAIVLLVLAAIAWVMKRTMRGKLGQQSSIRIVDGVSVGTRERVMVLEVADRWLVVGVAAGQVTSIANLPAEQSESVPTTTEQESNPVDFSSALTQASLKAKPAQAKQ